MLPSDSQSATPLAPSGGGAPVRPVGRGGVRRGRQADLRSGVVAASAAGVAPGGEGERPTQRAGKAAVRGGRKTEPRSAGEERAGKRDGLRRVLAQWRGVDLAPLEKAQALRAQPLSALLPKVLNELGIDRKRAEAEVVKVWNHLIDPTLTAHAQPTGLHKGTLFVGVDSNVWLSEIVRYRRKEILDRLGHCFGREFIKRISFRVG